MNKLLFYVFYKTQDCTNEDNFHVQCVKAWAKEDAKQEFNNLLSDKSYIRMVKVCNQIEYDAILKNNILICE
jgi:hypothetical protein